mmetsp:Transcript_855/g.2356  ORF Transcript_855/g.2356 Transcript_855/m.2356 type:complete len:570 (-) Transcript_855:69-1778(-)
MSSGEEELERVGLLEEENALMREVITDIHAELQVLRDKHGMFGSTQTPLSEASSDAPHLRQSRSAASAAGGADEAGFEDRSLESTGFEEYTSRLQAWETRLAAATRRLRPPLETLKLKDAACGASEVSDSDVASPRSVASELESLERAASRRHRGVQCDAVKLDDGAECQELRERLGKALNECEELVAGNDALRERADRAAAELADVRDALLAAREEKALLEVKVSELEREKLGGRTPQDRDHRSRAVSEVYNEAVREAGSKTSSEARRDPQESRDYRATVLELEKRLGAASSANSVAQCERARAEARRETAELKCAQLEELLVGFRREVALAERAREQFDVLVRERNEARASMLKAQSLLEDAQRRERHREEADLMSKEERREQQRREEALRQRVSDTSKALAAVDAERIRLKEYLVRYEKELSRNERKVKQLGAVYEHHERELFRARQASAERDGLRKRIVELEQKLGSESSGTSEDLGALRDRIEALQSTAAILRRDAADYASRYERAKRKLRAASQARGQPPRVTRGDARRLPESLSSASVNDAPGQSSADRGSVVERFAIAGQS